MEELPLHSCLDSPVNFMILDKIPSPLIAEVADAIASHLGSHSKIAILFQRCGAPGPDPPGNMVDRISAWLRAANDDQYVDAFVVLGCLLEDFMERASTDPILKARMTRALAVHGLSYHQGGRIIGNSGSLPSRTVEAMIRERDLPGLEIEFRRALQTVDTDPPTAITAASSILETLCRLYIEAHSLPMPRDLSLGPLYAIVRQHLGIGPAGIVSDDLRKILGGMNAVTDGVGSLRTHAGSAHGHGHPIPIEPRHARLAVHAAHTVVIFILDSWT